MGVEEPFISDYIDLMKNILTSVMALGVVIGGWIVTSILLLIAAVPVAMSTDGGSGVGVVLSWILVLLPTLFALVYSLVRIVRILKNNDSFILVWLWANVPAATVILGFITWLVAVTVVSVVS